MPAVTKKIAVVDDDPLILDLYVRKFKERGYDVLAMTDQTLSFEQLASFAPQVMLLDINMPTKSGLDVLAQMKESFKKLPHIILLTNNDDQSIADKGRELGASDYIIKVSRTPTEIADTVDAVFAPPL